MIPVEPSLRLGSVLWAVRDFGQQPHSFVTSEQENPSKRDLFVALSMRLELIVGEIDLGSRGASNVNTIQTQHSGNESRPMAQPSAPAE
jgi:hypothetical protein